MRTAAPIGGFFGLEPAGGPATRESVLERWTSGSGWIGFHNARSAFAYLVRSVRPATVWLPRYLCADMDATAGCAVRRYGVNLGLELDDATFEAALAPGDLVVAVAYFGAPVCRRLREIAERRVDVVWLEDRAQALDIGGAMAGAWRLYSPRKLLGVADGGLLVGPVWDLPAPSLGLPPESHVQAAEARAVAETREQVDAAYRIYVETERAQAVTDTALSDRTHGILAALEVDAMAARRRENFAALDLRLSAWAAPVVARLRGTAAPFGYPLLLGRGRDAVAAGLAADGLFCAVHWRDLGEAGTTDPTASRLRDGILTLPVDHRYGAADMDRLSGGVLRALV